MASGSRLGAWRANATRHAVAGAASTSPIGPHSQAQKIAERTIAKGDRPMRVPSSQGSKRLLLTTSSAKKISAISSGNVQPLEVATASAIGRLAATHGPA